MSDGEINANEHPGIPRVVAVEPRDGYLLWVAFKDGAKGLLGMTQDVQGKPRRCRRFETLPPSVAPMSTARKKKA